MKKERIIFHIDVNSAFLSWEAVRRLKEGDTLDLRTVPSAVGGDVKTRRGIITAKSIPAKAFGIQTGEPVMTALKKCPKLILVQSDFRLYRSCSHAFIAICREYTDKIEQVSIDECFMDVSESVKDHDPEEAVKLAFTIKDRVRDELGFTVNVGVSENKLLAKMASDFKKPDRVHTLWAEEIERKMWPLPVGDLLFVGRSSAERLRTLGVRTIGDLAKMPVSVLSAHFGEKAAISMHNSANGISRSPVSEEGEDEKSYGHETTLPYDYVDAAEVYPVLLMLSDRVSRRLRRDNVKAGLVTVSYKSNEFKRVSHQHKLELSTSSGDLIYREAVRLFDELWDQKTPIRLLGVSCGNITDGKNEQLNLFGEEERKKREKLDRMLDAVRNRFGDDAIMRTSEFEKRRKKDDPEDEEDD